MSKHAFGVLIVAFIFLLCIGHSCQMNQSHNQKLKHWCSEVNGFYTVTITGYGECELPGRSE